MPTDRARHAPPTPTGLAREWARALQAHDGRDDPAWDDFAAAHPRDDLRATALDGLPGLGASQGDWTLTLIDRLDDPELFTALARRVEHGPDLPLDRLWRALDLLGGTGEIEASPRLLELRDDLIDSIPDEDLALEQLIENLDESPEDVWFALQGLRAIEPDVRAQILEGVGDRPLGRGVGELLRLLCYSEDGPTRSTALAALGARPVADDDPIRVDAWLDLAIHHPDPAINATARATLAAIGGALATTGPEHPNLLTAIVSAIDGRGVGRVGLLTSGGPDDRRTAALFTCDVTRGVVAIDGETGPGASADSLLDDLRADPSTDAVEPAPDLARSLIAGCWSIGRPDDPAARFWVERTLGPGFRPAPILGELAATPGPFADGATRVLDACPDWIDRSACTYEIAEELLLRFGPAGPDPARDAGAFRFLFEHALRDRLEPLRRMLGWMAGFWNEAAEPDLAAAALRLADQLGDPQYAVPSHPFIIELASRSLAAAMRDLADRQPDGGAGSR